MRLIGPDGSQVGVVSLREAFTIAEDAGLDLVEISPNAKPPVCKVIDYGKYRYQLTKKEKESKKTQHQVKLKEVKMKPNIDEHDFQVKLKRAKEFLEKGNKVRVACTFWGRELAHTEVGRKLCNRFIEELEEVSIVEAMPKLLGRNMTMVMAPQKKKN